MNGFLLDVNLYFAALHPRHADHTRAQAWADRHSAPGSLKVCRVTQMGALRLLTSRVVMQEDLLTPQEAWAGIERSMEDPRLVFAKEPSDLEETWRRMSESMPGLVRIDTDTYLAAFALAADDTLATFDRGFARFPRLRFETPA